MPAPGNIEILAMSPAMLFEYEHEGQGHRCHVGDRDLTGLAELAGGDYATQYRRFQHGSGMVTSMERGRGAVLTAGSCEWIMVLTGHEAFTQAITRNVLDRVSAA